MWDLTLSPMCVVSENMIYFKLASDPALAERVITGHSEFLQDSVTLLTPAI